MPKEDRRIIFSYDEAYKAIYALCVQKEMRKPPPGNITAITIDGDDNKLHLQIHNRQDETAREVEYGRDFLAAALLLYCRSLSIPIPKSSKKSVDVKADNVILRILI